MIKAVTTSVVPKDSARYTVPVLIKKRLVVKDVNCPLAKRTLTWATSARTEKTWWPIVNRRRRTKARIVTCPDES